MNTWLVQYHNKCIDTLDRTKVIIEKKLLKIEEERRYLQGIFAKIGVRSAEKEERLKFLNERLSQEEKALKEICKCIETTTKDLIEKEFKKLESHPKIEDVETTGPVLTINIKKLKVFGLSIGRYQIVVDLNSNYLAIINRDYQVNEKYDHWFICNHKPCFGTWESIVNKYLETGHIFLCIDTLIHFLLSTNSEHGHLDVKSWLKGFKKKEKVATRQATTEPTCVLAYTGNIVGDSIAPLEYRRIRDRAIETPPPFPPTQLAPGYITANMAWAPSPYQDGDTNPQTTFSTWIYDAAS